MLVVGATGASRQGLQLRIGSQLLNPKPKINANKLGTRLAGGCLVATSKRSFRCIAFLVTSWDPSETSSVTPCAHS